MGLSFKISRCCSESILKKKSFRHYYIHYEGYVRRFKKKIVRVVSEIYKKELKVQILNEVALRQVERKRVSFQDARTKMHQNFLASKYDIKQHSDAT